MKWLRAGFGYAGRAARRENNDGIGGVDHDRAIPFLRLHFVQHCGISKSLSNAGFS